MYILNLLHFEGIILNFVLEFYKITSRKSKSNIYYISTTLEKNQKFFSMNELMNLFN